MTDPILEARGLSSGYGDFQALFSVNFAVNPGEIVALIGANGAGKSTLLRAMAGLLPLRSGAVHFEGRGTSGVPAHKLVGHGLVMVPEGRRLFAGMSVEDNLKVSLDRARTIVAPERPWTLERLYALFPILKEKRTQKVERLSGGQQQMVAIGRALLAQPKVLLCDEVSLGLAPKVIREIYEMIPGIRETGTAIVLVEQDVSLAQQAADRIYCMLEGRVTLTGRSSEISREEIASAYFGVRHELA
jgi:branched-chain amino acid transport system ATP-binding protein